MGIIWIILAAAAGYYAGKNAGAVKLAVDNRTRLEGAGDVINGIGKIFG